MEKKTMEAIIEQYKGAIKDRKVTLYNSAFAIIQLDNKLAEGLREPGDEYQPESFYHELTLKMGEYLNKRMFFPESMFDEETIKRYGKLYSTNREAFNDYLNSSTHRFLSTLFKEKWDDKKLREYMTKYVDDRISGKFNMANAPIGPYYDLQNSVTATLFQEQDKNWGNFNLQNMLCFIATDPEHDIYTLFLEQHLEQSRLILEFHENIRTLEKMMEE